MAAGDQGQARARRVEDESREWRGRLDAAD